MARVARVVVPGYWHHVTQRGNRRQTIFSDETDRAMYLQLLVRHCRQASVAIAGYCLMGNHVHLVAIPRAEDSLAKGLGETHRDYARWFNLKHDTIGHLWQNRFYSCILDGQHRWEALRYVELNPVRAGLVSTATEWVWSSAAAHVGGVDRTGLLETGEWSACWRASTWGEVLAMGLQDALMLERIRESTRTGRPIAEPAAVVELERITGRLLRPQKRGPKPKAAAVGAQLELGVS